MKRWFWMKTMDYAVVRNNLVEVTRYFLLGRRLMWSSRVVDAFLDVRAADLKDLL